MVYRVHDLGVVLLLFASGKIICTGARKVSMAEKAVDYLRKELENSDIL